MCSVVVVIVIAVVVAAAAQPFWKPAELNVGPVNSLTSDTAWLLSHINDPFFRRRAGVTYQNRKLRAKSALLCSRSPMSPRQISVLVLIQPRSLLVLVVTNVRISAG